MSVSVTIDGKAYDVPEGSRLIDVCRNVGIEIPHFCYHPGLGPDGNCRMCQVEIITPRGPILVISCNTIVSDGMEVATNSERVQKARAAVEEFLLLDHPLDCPICDKAGECTLQDYYYEYDLQDSRMKFPREKKRKAIVLGKTLVLDEERCVLCNRCARFLRDIAGDEELFIAGRGHKSYITTFPGREVCSAYSINTVDLCPVGALTSRDFRFSSPTWFLTRTPSVCPTCARGCSIEINHRGGRIYRLRPRYNEGVNGYWMCDEGRLNYNFANEDRVTEFEVMRNDKRIQVSAEVAVQEILSALRSAKPGNTEGEQKEPTVKILILASSSCTLEELFLVKKLSGALKGAALYTVRHIPDGVEDHILRRADRHANGKSAEALGIRMVDMKDGSEEKYREEIGELLSERCFVLGIGFNYGISEALLDAFSRAQTAVVVAACRTPIVDKASIIVPGLTFAGKDGLFINFEGHIQRLCPALAAKGDAVEEWKFLSSLLSSIEGSESYKSISELRDAIHSEEEAFNGVDLNAIGPEGVRPQNLPVGK